MKQLLLFASLALLLVGCDQLPCFKWHYMKVTTNDQARRRNEWQHAHSFQVNYINNRNESVTLDVCEYCHIVTSETVHTLPNK